ncbi:MAG: TRAP transporter small permease [Maritimibacter sp.]|nr:TRAP transporter small permease [Maritimibacter sp.]
MTGTGILRIEARIVQAISVLLGLGLIAMVVVNVANAVGRYTGWYALVYGMIWIVMLGSILAARNRDHLSINLLSSVAIGYNANILQIVVDLATVAVSAFIAWHSFVFIERIAPLYQTSMGLGVPMVIPHAAIFIGFAGMAAVTAFLTVADIARIARRKGHAK